MGFFPLPGPHPSCRGEGSRLSSAHALSPPGSLPKPCSGPEEPLPAWLAVPLVGLQRVAEQEVRLASFESCRPA
jgi:hypothetical protein